MKKTLFLVTELQKPVGGLHRFTTELLPAWRKQVKEGNAEFEPLVLSLRDPNIPLGDLKESPSMKAIASSLGIKVYEAVRGGETCFFIEASLDTQARNDFHKLLWDKYRVRSEKSAYDHFYQVLNAYWKYAPLVAQAMIKSGQQIAIVDAQDWLAFPAGFLIKEATGLPLSCRFHSGEYGRSLGNPDFSSPPVRIEAAALQEANYVQGVSIHEAKFELYNLLPSKQELYNQVSEFKSQRWRQEQEWKTENYEAFLLLEPQELTLITQCAAGITNGIILTEWQKVTEQDIRDGRSVLQKLLPGKEKYITFVGRAEYRKGIDALVQAFAQVGRRDCGLIISSVLSSNEYQDLLRQLQQLGIEADTVLYNGWLEEKLKKQLFCASDVICLPSLYEPFGLVTLEGLAADLACEKNGNHGPVVVVGDTGGMHEVIKNGVNGFKSPMAEEKFNLPPAYLAKILRLVLKDEELAKRISEGGAQRVKSQYFDWSYITLQIMEIYRRAIKNQQQWRE
jgi:glycosyltransferase involved in cell wall biosynthesis